MFQLKVFIVMVLIAVRISQVKIASTRQLISFVCLLFQGALGKPKDCKDGGKHHEKMKKIKQCHQQTMDLAACCDFPEPEMKDEYPECNEILEGLVEMEKKEQHKAMMCYVECIFKAEEVFDGENIDTDKMLADIEMMLEKADEAPFMNVSRVSVNFCQEKSKRIVNCEAYQISLT